jgi:hypothetical protein
MHRMSKLYHFTVVGDVSKKWLKGVERHPQTPWEERV